MAKRQVAVTFAVEIDTDATPDADGNVPGVGSFHYQHGAADLERDGGLGIAYACLLSIVSDHLGALDGHLQAQGFEQEGCVEFKVCVTNLQTEPLRDTTPAEG